MAGLIHIVYGSVIIYASQSFPHTGQSREIRALALHCTSIIPSVQLTAVVDACRKDDVRLLSQQIRVSFVASTDVRRRVMHWVKYEVHLKVERQIAPGPLGIGIRL